MNALPGLAILLLATIGAARVVVVTVRGVRRVVASLHARVRAWWRRPQVDAQALVSALAELIERRAARREALCDDIERTRVTREPLASDTVIDMPRARRAS